MDVEIKFAVRHGHLAESTQELIREKVSRLLHLFDRITFIEVLINNHDKAHKEVEIKVDAEHKHDFVARDQHDDLLAAVDMAVDRIRHQIHKYKEKIQDHRRDPHHGQS